MKHLKDYMTISVSEAKRMRMTHTATMYGFPVYIRICGEHEPKFYQLAGKYWMTLWIVELISVLHCLFVWLVLNNPVFEIPVKNPIEIGA